jgi:hypothetical protein
MSRILEKWACHGFFGGLEAEEAGVTGMRVLVGLEVAAVTLQ